MIFQPGSGGSGGLKIASGSYVGTGAYSSDEKNVIYPGFKVKILIIFKTSFYPVSDNSFSSDLAIVPFKESGEWNYSGPRVEGYVTGFWSYDDRTEFISNTSASAQFNSSGETYYYIALG